MSRRPNPKLLSPRWLLSHLFVVVVVTMVNLGFWQLRRLDERRDRNDAIRLALAQEPVALDELEAEDLPPDYTVVRASGVYRPEHELLVANRSFDGAAGSWLVTPLEQTDETTVAVVRGWVPRLVTAGVDERPTDAPSGPVAIEGLAFDSVGGGRIAAVEEGEIPQLSRMDLGRYEEVTGLDVIDVWISLRTQAPPQDGDLPIPVPDPQLDEGPHLSYAFQWFSFSVGTVVFYWLILRRTARSKS